MERHEYEKRGYLLEDFKVFYLEELISREIEYHYHGFDKLLVFYKGNIDYLIEGSSYSLLPNDIVLVPRGDPHKVKPVTQGEEDIGYTRLVIYLSPQYLMSLSEDGYSLRDCFRTAEQRHSYVIRPREKGEGQLMRLASGLRDSVFSGGEDGFGALYQRSLVVQLLILINRKMSDGSVHYVDTRCCNEKIVELICHINRHLTEELSIDDLAKRVYLSKYHMMRQFKAETGYTVGGYINQKRLLLARELLRQGQSVTQAYLDAGFHEHSTFIRAYKKLFGEMPSRTRD